LQLGVDDHTGLINTDIPGSKGMSPSQDVLRLWRLVGLCASERKSLAAFKPEEKLSSRIKLIIWKFVSKASQRLSGVPVRNIYVLPINDLVEVTAENH
jgi:hypothetical protein